MSRVAEFRQPSTLNAAEGANMSSGDGGALFVPCERQVANPLQLLRGKRYRLVAIEDALDDVGREERELE